MRFNLILLYISITACSLLYVLLYFDFIPLSAYLYFFFNIMGILFCSGIKDELSRLIAFKTFMSLTIFPFLIALMKYSINTEMSITVMLILFLAIFYLVFFDSLTYTLFQKNGIKPRYVFFSNTALILPNTLIVAGFGFFRDFVQNSNTIIVLPISIYYIIILIYVLINRRNFYKLYLLNKEISPWKKQ